MTPNFRTFVHRAKIVENLNTRGRHGHFISWNDMHVRTQNIFNINQLPKVAFEAVYNTWLSKSQKCSPDHILYNFFPLFFGCSNKSLCNTHLNSNPYMPIMSICNLYNRNNRGKMWRKDWMERHALRGSVLRRELEVQSREMCSSFFILYAPRDHLVCFYFSHACIILVLTFCPCAPTQIDG